MRKFEKVTKPDIPLLPAKGVYRMAVTGDYILIETDDPAVIAKMASEGFTEI